MTLDFTPEIREKAWTYLSDRLKDYSDNTIDLRVAPILDQIEVRQFVENQNLEKGIPYREAIDYVLEGFTKFHVHTPHPHYMGLFNPRTSFPSIMGDTVAATINPQMASWSHAPFGVEIESHVIRELGKKFGIGENTDGVFTSGGAEANLTALCCALQHRFPGIKEKGVNSINVQPRIYASKESHHSILKAAVITGLGTEAVVSIDVDDDLQMRMDVLREKIENDIKAGKLPFMVVGTEGTTGAGAFDDLKEIREIADRYEMWMHADAAYGGACILTKDYNHLLDGIQKADSITFDAHKWLSVPMGAGIFLTPHMNILSQAFNMTTDYMPKDAAGMEVVDPYNHSIQWSRRSTAMKLYMALLMIGWEGYGQSIQDDIETGKYMKAKLEESGWKVYNKTDLPILCFNREDKVNDPSWVHNLVQRLIRKGRMWLSVYPVGDISCARVCITNFLTRKKEIDVIVDLINQEIEN
ncbi:MAG: aminotransferase class V-fold PLP-dependent enzyme [Saprospiraceae bacterium]|nr:aminotransferase class V-fold PLP-dependent enzyme [Saprospiraceae bacterium]